MNENRTCSGAADDLQLRKDDTAGWNIWSRLRLEWPGLLVVFCQLFLAAVVINQLDILTSAVRRVFYLAVLGFGINHFLPRRHRMTFFVLLCAGSLLVVLGGSPDSLWDPALAVSRSLPLIACGGALIGIAMLPLGFWTKVALLAAAATVVAMLRADVFGPQSLLIIWPVLASLFMFRLMIFLYDLSTSKTRPTLREVFAYFLLFPNSSSALFPLVDFKTMVRSHYDSDAVAIYQRGAHWIVRGILQLLLYRLLKQLVAIEPESVSSGEDLAQFILASTFAYLQVSGLFHLLVGMLLLFGFNLPETNRRYFLAASFTDYWRRVNIYWKDFILKVFYYPVYFRLKSRGATFALIVATLWSFFITWVLHLYQTWWLKGETSLRWPDVLFWSLLGLLVLVNSLWEMKRGRQRKLASSTYDPRSAAGLMLRTAGTFACISLLWSLWSTPTLTQWLALWRHADWNTAMWGAAALAGIMVATLIYEIVPTSGRILGARGPAVSRFALRPALLGIAGLSLALALAQPGIQSRMQHASLQPWLDALSTGESMINQLSAQNRGYYERLTSADGANIQLWETLTGLRQHYRYGGEDPSRRVNDFRFREAIPSVALQAYDTEFRTNARGMRDDEYGFSVPQGTVRIALLGSSHTMGWGVRKEETFEALLEARLNVEAPAAVESARFEVLNFAFNGLSPMGQIAVVQKQVAAFQPHIVLFIAHPGDYDWVNRDLSIALREGVPVEDEFLQGTLERALITRRTHEIIAGRRLREHEPALLHWSYSRIVEETRRLSAAPIAALVPVPNDLVAGIPLEANQAELISRAGFVLFDLAHVYDHVTPQELMLAEGSRHTNALGHRILAAALYDSLASYLSANSINLHSASLVGTN